MLTKLYAFQFVIALMKKDYANAYDIGNQCKD